MAVIQTRQLQKRFGKTQALTGVDLDVQQGEVYGFIGPNGAGKSTTIRCLLGIIKSNAGTAHIFGQDCWAEAMSIHKRIAYVPGDVNLWNNLSGGEVIDLFLRLRKGRERRYLDELVQRFDFDPSKKCGSYSKGNRQKVALIAAFSADAELYILDEPTSGLDPLMEQVFRQCVADVKSRGATVFLSSHILSEVEQLCDRISIIRAGKIIDSGTLDEMRHLTRNKIELLAALPLTGIEQLPGIHDLAQNPESGKLSFSIDNAQTPTLLSFLADKNVQHLTSNPPTLEELFISHYSEQASVTTSAATPSPEQVAAAQSPEQVAATTSSPSASSSSAPSPSAPSPSQSGGQQ